MNLGHVGGKRVLAPRVTGNDVTSNQSARLPPRDVVVSLDDVDVTAHRDMSEHPIPLFCGVSTCREHVMSTCGDHLRMGKTAEVWINPGDPINLVLCRT